MSVRYPRIQDYEPFAELMTAYADTAANFNKPIEALLHLPSGCRETIQRLPLAAREALNDVLQADFYAANDAVAAVANAVAATYAVEAVLNVLRVFLESMPPATEIAQAAAPETAPTEAAPATP